MNLWLLLTARRCGNKSAPSTILCNGVVERVAAAVEEEEEEEKEGVVEEKEKRWRWCCWCRWWCWGWGGGDELSISPNKTGSIRYTPIPTPLLPKKLPTPLLSHLPALRGAYPFITGSSISF